MFFENGLGNDLPFEEGIDVGKGDARALCVRTNC